MKTDGLLEGFIKLGPYEKAMATSSESELTRAGCLQSPPLRGREVVVRTWAGPQGLPWGAYR